MFCDSETFDHIDKKYILQFLSQALSDENLTVIPVSLGNFMGVFSFESFCV